MNLHNLPFSHYYCLSECNSFFLFLGKTRGKEKKIRLELHTGFKAKVKTQVFMKETEDLIKESGWTECTYRSPPGQLFPARH